MTLNKEERKKIEEEEKYRSDLRKQLGNDPEIKKEKKKGLSPLSKGIAILFGIFVFVGVIGSRFSNNGTSTSPSTNDSSKRELVGDIKFSGTQFTITNLEKTDWNICYFMVNGKYYYPSKTSDWLPGQKLDVVKAGETITVGFANFTLKDGTRFNAYQTEPQNFTIACENGFGYWKW